MATLQKIFLSTILKVGLLITISLHSTVAQVGVAYGRLGSDLPCTDDVIALYKNNSITKMRIYDPHPPTLHALGGTGIELMVGIPEADLPDLAQCQCNADDWVKANILAYPDVNFRYIAVGNEVSTESKYAPFVLPAMKHIYNSLNGLCVGNNIIVSTSIKTDLLGKSTPPSEGEFKPNVTWYIRPIVEFLSDTRAPLLVNVYPYFAYLNDTKNIKPSFALLQPNSGENLGGVFYDNLFYAILDAVYAAMEKILASSSSLSVRLQSGKASVTVSESGHPGHKKRRGGGKKLLSDEDEEEEFSSVENARIYNNNLMRIVKNGTPKRPGIPIETYIFAMFDEDLKPGPEYERNFGIFYSNGRAKYPLRFY